MPAFRCLPARLAAALCALAACSPDPATDTAASRLTRTAADQTITLITGDRVTLTASGPVIEPAAGRGAVAFQISHAGDDVIVVPSDAAARIARHQLDPALFNVTRLLADGYGDAARADLPLIVAASDGASFARQLAAGATVTRMLPAVRAMAVRQPKTRAAAQLAAAPRIWLDRKHKVLLDHSVPQIGGPAAHARGLTGAGVVVAVIDTGVDSTHPDLADRVIAAENFTGDDLGVLDVLGHGTHVASILAGTGAASAGQLAGVAPGAQLVSGRVCSEFGECTDSAMLAGFEWAVVEQHARIVNVSIGGTDTPELDPLEAAIATLSAEHGALFVVSAGNDGGDGTINTPGSADAALTVGAVDRADQLAPFSSRGPRTGDHAIKPDLTAPGVAIVAALAAGPEPIGQPVGDAYQALSGTSMAAPHVAGAAALVAQQHPEWTGAQLKAQLIGTAEPTAGLTAFQQGSGRLDVDRATRQAVTAEPPSISLGLAVFPHGDDPVLARTVTYHNRGAAPVTLALAVTLAGPGGAPGEVALDADQLTVPAGGTASATVSVDTRGAGPDGGYSGALVATAGDTRIETPIAVDREVESYDVHLRVLDTTGQPAITQVSIAAGDVAPLRLIVDREATVRLPRGAYAIDMFATESPLFGLSLPRLDVSADRDVTLDARLTRSPTSSVPDADARLFVVATSYLDRVTGHLTSIVAFGDLRIGHAGPELPAGELLSWLELFLRTESRKDVYFLGRREAGHAITGTHQVVTADQLATVANHFGAEASAVKFAAGCPEDGDEFLCTGASGYDVTGPSEVTEHYLGAGLRWQQEMLGFSSNNDLHAVRRYRPGQRTVERWDEAPFGPAFAEREIAGSRPAAHRLVPSAARTGDTLTLRPSMVTDRARHETVDFGHGARVRLLRDGVVIADRIDRRLLGLPPTVVPPGEATYRFEQTADSFLGEGASFRVEAAWTFRSGHAAGTEILPLPVLHYEPALDDQGRTSARVLALPFGIERPAGASTPAIADAALEVSFDDGASWRRVPVFRFADRAIALVVHPAGAEFVSLRGRARDVRGNAVEQTILRAYALAR